MLPTDVSPNHLPVIGKKVCRADTVGTVPVPWAVHFHNFRHAFVRYGEDGPTKGGNVTSAGWQVTLCDPMWHVSSRSGVATLRTAIHLLLNYLLSY